MKKKFTLKNHILVLIFSLSAASLFSTKAFGQEADDDCVAGLPTAQFSAKTAKVKNYEKQVGDKGRQMTEKFLLDGVGNIEVVQGGCAHFGKSVAITMDKPKSAPAKFEQKFWLKFASETLSKLPASKFIVDGLKSELKDQEPGLLKTEVFKDEKRSMIETTDKDGYDTVSIEVTEKGSKILLTVAMHTAL